MPALHRIALSPVLDISAAPALLTTCKEIQDHSETVSIDASHVERITTPAFQVLVSLIKTRKAAGHTTHLGATSTAFNDAAASLGLSAFFKEEAPNG